VKKQLFKAKSVNIRKELETEEKEIIEKSIETFRN